MRDVPVIERLSGSRAMGHRPGASILLHPYHTGYIDALPAPFRAITPEPANRRWLRRDNSTGTCTFRMFSDVSGTVGSD